MNKWLTVQLRTIVESSSGIWGEPPLNDGTDIPILRSTNIHEGRLVLHEIAERSLPNHFIERYRLKDGDIIVTSSSGSSNLIGKCAIFYQPKDNRPYLFSNFTQRLRPNHQVVNPRYLYYYLLSPQAKAELNRIHTTTSGLRNLNIPLYLQQKIPLPPISEQRRIVEILDQADVLRKKRAEADAKAARILPALFYKMFGDPATNPMGWEQKPFDDTFDDCTAKFPKLQRNAYHKAGKFPVIDQGRELIAGYTDDESLVTAVDQPVIVFGDHTRIVKFVDFPFVAGADGSRVFMAKKGFSPAFLACQLELQPIPNLGYSRHMREVRRLHFIAPPFELQEFFTHRFMDARPLLKSQASCCSRVEALFQSLLHRAFTGDLTAKWREAHMKELLAEMEEQAKILQASSEAS